MHGMPVQYYRPCVKAVGPNRTEPDLRASTFARAVLAATDMVEAAAEVVATVYAAGASKVKWSKSATGQVIKHVIPAPTVRRHLTRSARSSGRP